MGNVKQGERHGSWNATKVAGQSQSEYVAVTGGHKGIVQKVAWEIRLVPFLLRAGRKDEYNTQVCP